MREKFAEPRAAANSAHEAYYFCYDSEATDVICVFQLYRDLPAMQGLLKGAWYAEYPKAAGEFVAVPPRITPADLIWAKAQEQSP